LRKEEKVRKREEGCGNSTIVNQKQGEGTWTARTRALAEGNKIDKEFELFGMNRPKRNTLNEI